MEDRHYLSDPRPIKGLDLLTWDVDVMREGVDQPIMTLRLDSSNLPPRTRKKKVVWQLPDSWDQVPKFGKEDKLRILELFKQHKKTTKKEKRSRHPGVRVKIVGLGMAALYQKRRIQTRRPKRKLLLYPLPMMTLLLRQVLPNHRTRCDRSRKETLWDHQVLRR